MTSKITFSKEIANTIGLEEAVLLEYLKQEEILKGHVSIQQMLNEFSNDITIWKEKLTNGKYPDGPRPRVTILGITLVWVHGHDVQGRRNNNQETLWNEACDTNAKKTATSKLLNVDCWYEVTVQRNGHSHTRHALTIRRGTEERIPQQASCKESS